MLIWKETVIEPKYRGRCSRSIRGRTPGEGITAKRNYTIVEPWASVAGIFRSRTRCACLRATGATNPLEHEADIDKVQVWLGQDNIITTCQYDRRGPTP